MRSPGEDDSRQPGPWRVRFAGTTYRVKDQAALRRLEETGKVPPDALVQRPGDDGWIGLDLALGRTPQPAAEPPADPWAHWEGLDDDATPPPPAAAPAPPPAAAPAPPPPAPAPAPLAAVAPPPPWAAAPLLPPAPTGEVEEHEGDDPPVDAPVAAPPVARARPRSPAPGKVIPFPGPRPGRPATDGAHALASEPVPFPERAPVPPPPMELDLGPLRTPGDRAAAAGHARRGPAEGGPNWWRIGAIAGFGLLLLGVARFYVAMETTAGFGPPIPPPAVPPGAEGIVAPPSTPLASTRSPSDPVAVPATAAQPGAPAAVDQTYDLLERELRGQMMSGVQELGDADALESALLVELNRVRLQVVQVDVTVLAPPPAPDGEAAGALEVVEIRLRLRTDGKELDRELGAAALVVGKYMTHHALGVPLLEVAFEGLADGKLMRRSLDAEQAQQLYLARLSLADFLRDLTR